MAGCIVRFRLFCALYIDFLQNIIQKSLKHRDLFMIQSFSEHPFSPIFDENSRILILGSFPSVRSRETGFYYGHPQNRFWKVLSAIFETEIPNNIEEKKKFLYENKIALWDVIASCKIKGSSDSSVKDAVPNDISFILQKSRISGIFTNGNLAYDLYRRYTEPKTGIPAIKLPSTSPANASWKEERLISAWKIIKEQKEQPK